MATLAAQDFQTIKKWVKQNPQVYDEFTTWGLNKSSWYAAFQIVEDYMLNAFSNRPPASLRAAIESVTGATTAIRAQYVFYAWVNWRERQVIP